MHFRVFLLLIITFIVSGCGGKSPVEQGIEDQVLHISTNVEPESLDPAIATSTNTHRIIASLYEGLVSADPKTLEPEPGVASSWEISPNQKTYTFHFNPEARWSNGDPVTAQDFIYAYERTLNPKLGAEYATILYLIENAKAYHQKEITDFNEVGVKALDDQTLQITITQPTPYFLSLLSKTAWFPVHPPTLEKFDARYNRNGQWTRPEHIVSNGPFKLKDWRAHERLSVEANPHYWDRETVRLNGIDFHPIDDINTEERAFRSGQIHVTSAIAFNKLNTYRKKNPESLNIAPYLATYYYTINTGRPPLDDPRVRQALSMAIDREAITRNILGCDEDPAFCLTPPNAGGYNSSAKLKHSISEAQTLLAAAGYPNGEGFPSFHLLFNTQDNHRIIAEAIQQMWKKHLNIDVKLLNQDLKVCLSSRRNHDYDIIRASWIGDYNDPYTFLEVWLSNSSNNHAQWSNPEYDRLVKEGTQASSKEERFAKFQQAEAILLEESPVIPVHFYKSVYLKHPSVKSLTPNILNQQFYKYVYLEPQA